MTLLPVFFLFCFIKTAYSIIGGDPAATTVQFPFAAAINVQTSNSKFFCGGTLYSNQWVITAGQCVKDAVLFTINIGSNYLDSGETTRLTLATSEYFLHPDFNPTTLENDIGLIQFRAQIGFTDYITTIEALPTDTLNDGFYTRTFGWGQTSDSSSALSNVLNYIFVRTLSNAQCQVYYGNQINTDMICVVGDYIEGICHGDTGGALLQYNAHAKNTHVAVASFVSGNGCETPEPSGFTRTYPYVDWIRNTTGADI